MARKNIRGDKLLLSFDFDGTSYLYAGITDHDQNFERDMIEITDMHTPAEATEYMAGRMKHDLNVNGLHKPGTDEIAPAQQYLDKYTAIAAMQAGTIITVKRGGTATGEKYIEAKYIIKNVKDSAKDNDKVTESLSLQGTGAFEIKTVA
ncbi:phage tail tube protein [Marinifilum flexuosum]|uniref:Phage tail tube protein n=1 Tax=Marinifilum flexuosum TaxID=1117708 RepID=A0A419WMZ9_9BACT|nr:phage tail tube protein [Marinifilum flexuosum]RKD96784.1 phage tail tube protein [Marinifilum flexuosum]